MRGHLGLSAGITAPFAYGSLATRATAAASGALSVFIAARDPANSVVRAMEDGLPVVESLGDPDKLANSPAFSRAQLGFEGDIAAAARASVGLDILPSNAMSIGISAAGSVEFVRKSRYTLTIERTANNTLRMKLTDQRLAANTGTLALSATIKPLGLSASARPFMDKLVLLPAPVEALIGKYGTPSATIRQALNDGLARQGAALQGIVAAIGTSTSADGLVASLVDLALRRVGINGDSLTQFLQGDDIDKLARRIIEAMPVDSDEATTSLTLVLRAALKDAAGQLESGIRRDLVTAIQRSTGKDVAQALLDAAAAARVITHDVDTLAVHLRDPLIQAIRRYRSVLDQLDAAMIDLETKGLTVSLSRSLTVASSRQHTIDMEFVSGLGTPAIRSAFGAALRGDFRAALAIARQGVGGASGAAIRLHDCLLSEIDNRTVTRRAELSVLGETLSWEQVRSSEVRVTSRDQRIEVVSAMASVDNTAIAREERETLALSSTAAVLRGAVDGAIVYTIFEDEVTSDNLVERIGAIGHAGLIGKDAATAILGSTELQRDMSRARDLEICIAMQVTGPMIDRLAAAAAAGELYEAAVRNQVFVLDGGAGSRVLKALRKMFNTSDATTAILNGRGKTRKQLGAQFFGGGTGALVYGDDRLLYVMLQCNENADSICDSVANWTGLRQLAATATPGGAASSATVQAARTLNEQLSRSLAQWARPSNPLQMLTSESVSPWALSYMRMLLQFSGLAAREAVSVTLAWTSASGERLMRAV